MQLEKTKSFLGEELRRLILLARIVLFFENFWRGIWPIFALILLFLILAFLNVFSMLAYSIHILVLALFGGVLFFLILRLLSVRYSAKVSEINSRLNRDNDLTHDPLALLNENNVLKGADSKTEFLWEEYKRRIVKNLPNLKLNPPSPGIAKLDVFALRVALVLLTIISFFMGGGDIKPRIARALVPDAGTGLSINSRIELWVSPPKHTNLTPTFQEYYLSSGHLTQKATKFPDKSRIPEKNQPLEIPVDSKIIVQTHQISGRPRVILGGISSEMQSIEASESEKRFYSERSIQSSDIGTRDLKVVSDRGLLMQLPVKIIPDSPPQVEFLSPLKKLSRGNFTFGTEAKDDFSIRKVWAIIKPNFPSQKFEKYNEIKFDIAFPGLGADKLKGTVQQNFSSHRWAGTDVGLQIFAKDSKGQIGKSAILNVVLPERIFNHPTARALIGVRKLLNKKNNNVIGEAVRVLSRINHSPEHYFHKTNIFLNIAIARARLKYDKSKMKVLEVQKILWRTALLIEDGEFSIAENNLKNVWNEVGRAYLNDMDPKKFDQLLEKLSSALDEYLGALAKHLKKQGLDQSASKMLTQSLETKSLQQLLNRARSLAKSGSKDLAYKMLSQLNRMLKGIREGVRVGKVSPWAKAARKMMDDLRGITKRQQSLVDKNYGIRNGNRTFGFKPDSDVFDSRSNKIEREVTKNNGSEKQIDFERYLLNAQKTQGQIRQELEKLKNQIQKMLGSTPGQIGKAGVSMDNAINKFRKRDTDGAISEQLKALNELRGAVERTSESVARRLQAGSGKRNGLQIGGFGEPSLDPFGRPAQGFGGQSNERGKVKIPTERVIHRTKEIFDELQRRSGERLRPQQELEFIDRLLERF